MKKQKNKNKLWTIESGKAGFKFGFKIFYKYNLGGKIFIALAMTSSIDTVNLRGVRARSITLFSPIQSLGLKDRLYREDIVLCERNQSQEDKYHMIPFTGGIKKSQTYRSGE